MAIRDQIKILVVDDMSTSRGLIVQALEGFGVKNVATVENGDSAVRSISANPVHIVISDYNMPGMDGLHLLQRLRSSDVTKGIGFILITGRTEKKIIELGRKLGMNNFLKKPFEPSELRSCIEAVVGPL